eukprot:TRINITY_DN8800_c0_g1_i1.p1 TRINITY_DN8800_c0_g1~~TRINITY_DN8800_c0_g1_i1.p1  ORF type:complete len:310 (+),score=41.72 TRINITY_DN8800_c0_g1_i1:81-932(+)
MNKSSGASHDSVIDETTRMLLYKYMNTDLLREINGVISVGKEAHVYHAIAGDPTMNPPLADSGIAEGSELAIKIFHKDMRGFRDRSMYYDDRGTANSKKDVSVQRSHNSQKLIKVWAEKEMRNLLSMSSNGLLCPKPILVRQNVIIMQFLGKKSVAAPRLKDAPLSAEKCVPLYHQTIQMMRKLYQDCDLVHADLSEYNILYHRGRAWFIDVSQSVVSSHHNAQDFLMRDCKVVNAFFSKKGVATLSNDDLLEFVQSVDITKENMDEWLDDKYDSSDDESLEI